jgi:hypothetical protein
MGTDAVRFLVVWMAGWVNSRQLEVIDFLREENRVLREQLGDRRPRFNDDQRRRLAVKGRIGETSNTHRGRNTVSWESLIQGERWILRSRRRNYS